MTVIQLELIYDHPDNANVMTGETLDKLADHIKRSGRYPPLIVRPHPQIDGAYQLLDGHHRAAALRRLGRTEAICDIWPVDDDEADELLLTLNRLRGEDDPTRRAALLKRVRRRLSVADMAKRLPENAQRIERLLATLRSPPPLAPAPSVDDMPQPLTFFLTAQQRAQATARLREYHDDRTTALLVALGIDSQASV